MSTELILLSRVAYRDGEITGPRLRGLLALLAGDLRSGCSTARLMDGRAAAQSAVPAQEATSVHVLAASDPTVAVVVTPARLIAVNGA